MIERQRQKGDGRKARKNCISSQPQIIQCSQATHDKNEEQKSSKNKNDKSAINFMNKENSNHTPIV